MKKIKILVLFAALAVLAACEKDNGKDKNAANYSAVVGEWKLESWYGQSATADVTADVYLSFAADNSFELFQKLGDAGHYTAFDGTCGLNSDGALCGIYSDGTSWGGTYKFSVESDRLTLENTEASVSGVSIYVRTTIPASVKKDAEDYGTKAFFKDASEKPLL